MPWQPRKNNTLLQAEHLRDQIGDQLDEVTGRKKVTFAPGTDGTQNSRGMNSLRSNYGSSARSNWGTWRTNDSQELTFAENIMRQLNKVTSINQGGF